ncbi:hypothetical protein A6R68_09141, partial [Neotoma lepida]
MVNFKSISTSNKIVNSKKSLQRELWRMVKKEKRLKKTNTIGEDRDKVKVKSGMVIASGLQSSAKDKDTQLLEEKPLLRHEIPRHFTWNPVCKPMLLFSSTEDTSQPLTSQNFFVQTFGVRTAGIGKPNNAQGSYINMT